MRRQRNALFCVVIAACLACQGCATTPSASASRVADADQSMVAGCQFVGEVQGSSG